MVHLPIPSKLKGSSRAATPVPSRSATPRPDDQQQAPKSPPMALVLQVAIIQARNLVGKDKSGSSHPFLMLTYNDQRFSTQTAHKTVNPAWNAVFDVTITQGPHSELLEAVCWDRDRFRKEYLGEFGLSIPDIFPDGPMKLEDSNNQPKWIPLTSSRKRAKITGEVQVKAGLVDPGHPDASKDELRTTWNKFIGNLERTIPSAIQIVLNAPSTEPAAIGMARADTFDTVGVDRADSMESDAGGYSSAEEDLSSPEADDTPGKKQARRRAAQLRRKLAKSYAFNNGSSDVVGVVFMEVQAARDLPPERNMTRTGFDMDPFVIISFGKKTFRTRVIRHCLNPIFNERLIFQVMNNEKTYRISFNIYDRDKLSSNDFVAQASLPLSDLIQNAPTPDPETGLYKLADPWRDSDAGRPKAKRQDSMLGRILSRSSSSTNLGKAKGGNGKSGTVTPSSTCLTSPSTLELTRSLSATSLSDLGDTKGPTSALTSAPTSAPAAPPVEDKDLKQYVVPLHMKKASRWEDKHNPELIINTKYVPYAALRQQFWRCLLNQYDVDESGRLTRLELVTMLDSLGSTLSEATINSFFERYHEPAKDPDEIKEVEEITIDHAVICLEEQLMKQPKGPANKATIPSVLVTSESPGEIIDLPKKESTPANPADLGLNTPEPEPSNGHDIGALQDPDDKAEEHVIMIVECPLCHQPRLNKRSEVDIVTHLATCASQDWRQVNTFVMAGFVTSDQAHRKWYTKVISKITYGGYKLGANSANILVQDRLTGQIQEERMSVYIRLGIRLLYKGLKSTTMEQKKIKQLLRSLSIKQGRKFDNPLSAQQIKGFIDFHQLDMSEVLLPVEEFKNFNEFFYRKLKPDARPCTAPDNPSVVVSPADCRCVVFNKIEKATEIWIKGKDFNMQRLLGPAYPDEAAKYENGALGIFRLAPQDYHRFHVPVDGVLGEPKLIEGQYYTVNPMAIRSALDVYGENIRVVVPIDTEQFGRVMVVCVGAMMVGSTVITAKQGQKVKRTDELGYFKFGGSTLVVLFQPGTLVWDDDLVTNASQRLETLVRVGQSVGHHPTVPQVVSENEKMKSVTENDLRDAARRISGYFDR